MPAQARGVGALSSSVHSLLVLAATIPYMAAALERLSPDHFDDIVSVMCDAFHDYPVMRFIVGEVTATTTIACVSSSAYFVYRRVALNAPVFGMVDRGSVVAAATMTPPAEPEMPAEVIARRDAAWAALGDEARLRYEAYAAATKPFTIASPHHHLNMIGVRHAHMGQGWPAPSSKRRPGSRTMIPDRAGCPSRRNCHEI